MLPRPPSINTLARTLGVSRTTVSDALRGKGRVAPETVSRIRAEAKAAGYRVNPLVATVLGSINRGPRPGACHGSLAVIDLVEPGHPHGPFPLELIAGARERAAAMGFALAEFSVGPGHLAWSRLDGILRSRGTHGVIVLPTWFPADFSAFDWSRYACINTDYATAGPEMHSVSPDHYGSMLALGAQLAARGYRRPGLVLERQRDVRIARRQSSAFRALQTDPAGGPPVPPLITAAYPDFQREFAPWFREHRPDVVLSHFPETRDWIRACRPEGEPPGFVLLNILHRTEPCAGLDLQPRLLGARAAEMVVGQILRNEFGIPAWPSRTTVQARWVEGPTVRALPAGPELSAFSGQPSALAAAATADR